MRNTSVAHWEDHLLSLAHDAQKSSGEGGNVLHGTPGELEDAYRQCDEITRIHSKTFYTASGLLKFQKRRASRALYAFCRISDDLVDRSTGDASAELEAWRLRTVNANPTGEDAVALAWIDTCQRFQIPWRYAEQLIEGVATDLYKVRYDTFTELATYCYGVACTVGLMAMHIIGHRGSEAIPYAIRVGVALQLTNILRDIGEDYQAGRLYLPSHELSAFNVREEEIVRGEVTPRWRDFMRFQIERTRRLYQEGLPGVSLLDPDGRFAIGAAAELYEAILSGIEENDYDVFYRRASIGKFGKLKRLPGIWWRSTRARYRHPDPKHQLPESCISSQIS